MPAFFVGGGVRGEDVYKRQALNCGTGCLQEYNYLVKKVVFKVEILPVIKLISCLFVHVFFVLIMFFVFLISGKKPELSWIQIIYYSFATSMYACLLYTSRCV